MRRKMLSVAVMLVGISLALPATGNAWYRHHGYYRPYWGGAAFAGGVVLGTAIARPWYYAPPPAYVYPAPAPVYAYPPPAPDYVTNQAYAYPDPAATGAPSAEPAGAGGQWVDVPAQSVNGQWVPAHKAWVPAAP